jgi:hypothetical protein
VKQTGQYASERVRQAQLKIPPLAGSAAEAATRKQAEVTDR